MDCKKYAPCLLKMVYVYTSTILSLQITKVEGENFVRLSSMGEEREI